MDGDMLNKPAKRPVSSFIARRFSDFCAEEEGGITIFVIFMFVLMIIFGGIAVDVMRYEWRRVTLQETMDRAMLAAASLVIPPSQSPQSVAQNWFDVAGLGDELTVDFSAPVLQGEATSSSREVTGTARVRSYNHFMHMVDIPWFEGPVSSAAQQGVSKIEVILALDVTGSMAQSSGSTTKIEALRQAASNFVTILKYNRDGSGNYTIPKDPNNLIAIGLVPYSSNVNIPVDLRNQFAVSHLSSWDYVDNQGVPDINCFEIPPDTFGTMELSRSNPIPMAAVAQTGESNPNASVTLPGADNTNGRNGGVVTRSYAAPVATNTNSGTFMCNHGDNPSTAANERASNLLQLPTTDISTLRTQINALNPRGNTSIALGMRWATALIDQSARPIYSALRSGVPGMSGLPANNNDPETRKIIVLMTDGTHVASRHILDAFKSGPSPIWRGADGRMAIEFNDSGIAPNGGTRPGIAPNGTPRNSCSGWSLADTVVNGAVVKRNIFVPHLKANSVRLRVNSSEPEGQGTGTNVSGGCDPRAWVTATGTPAAPSWTGSGVVRRLDWSEVWRYASVDWVIEQLYMRSNVVGATNYDALYDMFVGDYLVNAGNMDNLLSENCTAAKAAGVEVFGIVLGDNVTEAPVRNCSSPGTGYYYRVTNADNLNAAFEQIAVLISPLRLTQ
jgi:hypothetical protein